MLNGADNHYTNVGFNPPRPVSPYTENGKKAEWPERAYSTDFYTGKLISYLEDNQNSGQPFFAYAAYTSPHWPLQVDPKYADLYRGRYDDVYVALKRKRFENQKKLGLIPKDAELPKPHPRVTPWDSLTEKEQKKEARKMELYAGMVDNLDFNIGRLLQYLEEIGQYENTLIVFISNNGNAAEDFYNHKYFGSFIREHYNNDYDNM